MLAVQLVRQLRAALFCLAKSARLIQLLEHYLTSRFKMSSKAGSIHLVYRTRKTTLVAIAALKGLPHESIRMRNYQRTEARTADAPCARTPVMAPTKA